jgi:hypothetical protein
VLLTDPGAVGPAFTGLFMEKMVGFITGIAWRRPRMRMAAATIDRENPDSSISLPNTAPSFVKLYFPVFLLGAVFGKLIELSGFSRSIVAAAIFP